ncbi:MULTISPECIES: hypothetical protein [unclassified Rhizobium]|uniref:hypothetical protein n=1 Tax=unclassified Rhizobium TaxID=2613769 RepID=UPI001C8338A1|nr:MULTISPECIES: hypothetical protein [unclassified Rhizobium]MBX5227378.1 hypothetical protein [Rhizobium sp. NLR9b]MBX5238994.1 hypothetical protein [Rhizobium sp. NLR22b]MBX5288422.1 hypothetical protein [Rhizobium sp. NLR10b]
MRPNYNFNRDDFGPRGGEADQLRKSMAKLFERSRRVVLGASMMAINGRGFETIAAFIEGQIVSPTGYRRRIQEIC